MEHALANTPIVLFRAEKTVQKDDGTLGGFRFLRAKDLVGQVYSEASCCGE